MVGGRMRVRVMLKYSLRPLTLLGRCWLQTAGLIPWYIFSDLLYML